VGLLGSNGGGKTTLLRILCGAAKLESGIVTINGYDLIKFRRQAQRELGFVAQRFGLYPDLRVNENLCFCALAHGIERSSASQRVDEMVARFGLEAFRKSRGGALSYGWQQRLALAAALIHRPAVLLLDEPTAGLDPEARLQIWEELEREASRGAAVLLSTHHVDEAARCSSLLRLRSGRVEQEAPDSHLATKEAAA
jgi:ABC-2 type transport system ATP-binding protein